MLSLITLLFCQEPLSWHSHSCQQDCALKGLPSPSLDKVRELHSKHKTGTWSQSVSWLKHNSSWKTVLNHHKISPGYSGSKFNGTRSSSFPGHSNSHLHFSSLWLQLSKWASCFEYTVLEERWKKKNLPCLSRWCLTLGMQKFSTDTNRSDKLII